MRSLSRGRGCVLFVEPQTPRGAEDNPELVVWFPSLPSAPLSAFSQSFASGGKPGVILVFLFTKRAQLERKPPGQAGEVAPQPLAVLAEDPHLVLSTCMVVHRSLQPQSLGMQFCLGLPHAQVTMKH